MAELDSRRRFLKLATAGLSSALASLAGLPVLGAWLTPLFRRPTHGANASKFVHACKRADLSAGAPTRVDLVSPVQDAWSRQNAAVVGTAWLTLETEGSVRAHSSVCPHLGCSVNWSNGGFQCPCHDSFFKADGARVSGPSPRGLDSLEVRVEGEDVWVRPAWFKHGVSEKQET